VRWYIDIQQLVVSVLICFYDTTGIEELKIRKGKLQAEIADDTQARDQLQAQIDELTGIYFTACFARRVADTMNASKLPVVRT
jgi:hypothetical protein